MDAFLDDIFNGCGEKVRDEIPRMAATDRTDIRVATEEYLARMAEDGTDPVSYTHLDVYKRQGRRQHIHPVQPRERLQLQGSVLHDFLQHTLEHDILGKMCIRDRYRGASGHVFRHPGRIFLDQSLSSPPRY